VANQPPDVPDGGTDTTPRNTAPSVPIYIGFFRVLVTDPESQAMDVSFYWGNGTLIGIDTAVTSGSTATIPIPTLAYNTTYYWYVSIDDKFTGITRGPAGGNWSYATAPYVPIPPGGPNVHIHNFYVTVIDDATNLAIANAHCVVVKNWHEPGVGANVKGQGYTNTYGAWSCQLQEHDGYGLIVTAIGYTESLTVFDVNQGDVFITIRMTTIPAPVGLTNEQGGLSSVGFIFLAILILVIIGVFYLWYNNYGGKKRRR
jgi:hypothetical protein